MSVINTATNTVSATITVGSAPYAIGNFISIYPQHAGLASLCIEPISISLYPNPATNYLTIETKQKSEIDILNLQGQIIKNIKTTENHTNIDISAFPSGMYFVKVNTEKGMAVKKFVKE